MLFRLWLSGLVFTGLATCFQSYCKCDCEVNYEILELETAHGCSQCTVQYCLDQKIDMCRDPENRELMTAYCFQRESYKDMVIIYGFCLIVLVLLGAMAAKLMIGRIGLHRA